MSAQFLGLVQLCRPKQWIKNSFVLAPLLFAGLFTDLHSVQQAFIAMLLFCVASSATYIVNDLKDIEKDRLHPVKSKTRPLAAAKVSIQSAKLLLVSLYVLIIAASFWQHAVCMIVALYLLLNVAYSSYLKHQPVLDIFTISLGFVLRVYAGAVALDVPVSSWMFITTLCLALYLAAIKRRQELGTHGTTSRKALEGYSVALLDRYAEMSAVGALLFYSIFVVTSRAELVLTIPLVIFGMFRYWYITDIQQQGESPTDAIFSDLQLILTGLIWVIACLYGVWSQSNVL